MDSSANVHQLDAKGNAPQGSAPPIQENPPPSYNESGQAMPVVGFSQSAPVYPSAGYPVLQQPGLSGYPIQQAPGYPQQVMAGYPVQGVPGFPVTAQPQAMNWMVAPPAPPGCPPGLEYLSTIETLVLQQKVEALELITGFETENKYVIQNNEGQNVYLAAEKSGCCQRQLCCGSRDFQMKIVDNYQNQLIHLNRPLRCQSCWCYCCLQFMEVTSPPGTVIGTVEQTFSLIRPLFNIKDAAENVVLKIRGPICTCSMFCNDVVFQIYDPKVKASVGHITKKWSGFVKESFTDADNFRVSFPKELDVKLKAILLGACFLIDFMYFENSNSALS